MRDKLRDERKDGYTFQLGYEWRGYEPVQRGA